MTSTPSPTIITSILPTITALINSTTNSTSNSTSCVGGYDVCYDLHTNIHVFSIVFPTVIGGLLLISGLLYLCTDGSGWTLIIPCIIVSPVVVAGIYVAAAGFLVWYTGVFLRWCIGAIFEHWLIQGCKWLWRGVKRVGRWCWYPIRERKEIRRRREERKKAKEEKKVEDEKRELEERRRKAGPVMIEATEVV
ncbi:hypothetical protein BDZ45DRAFT_751644 [Acephala macrosclerotiorum]|nr:hypothetical protein BDZ45DRAFT_751644 [Acephala macrosclerotiorum]